MKKTSAQAATAAAAGLAAGAEDGEDAGAGAGVGDTQGMHFVPALLLWTDDFFREGEELPPLLLQAGARGATLLLLATTAQAQA